MSGESTLAGLVEIVFGSALWSETKSKSGYQRIEMAGSTDMLVLLGLASRAWMEETLC